MACLFLVQRTSDAYPTFILSQTSFRNPASTGASNMVSEVHKLKEIIIRKIYVSTYYRKHGGPNQCPQISVIEFVISAIIFLKLTTTEKN